MKLIFLCGVCFTYSLYSGVIDWVQSFVPCQTRAYHFYQNKTYDQALKYYGKLLDINPYDGIINYNSGVVLYRQHEYEVARASFVRAAEHALDNKLLQEQSYFNAGHCAYALENWQQAVDHYQHVLTLNPDNQQAYQALQQALAKLQQNNQVDQDQSNMHNNAQDKASSQNFSSQDKHNKISDPQGQSQSEKNQKAADDHSMEKHEGKAGHEYKEDQLRNGAGDDQKENKGQTQELNRSNDAQEPGFSNQDSAGQDTGASEQKKGQADQSNAKNGQGSLTDAKKQFDDILNHDYTMPEKDAQQKEMNVTQNHKQNKADLDANNTEKVEEKSGASLEKKSENLQENTKISKKVELKDEFKEKYESKTSKDERLSEYHAMVIKSLEELEEGVQKHVIKSKIGMQGTKLHGQKGW